jgi:hypothetical protein
MYILPFLRNEQLIKVLNAFLLPISRGFAQTFMQMKGQHLKLIRIVSSQRNMARFFNLRFKLTQ